MTRTLLVLLTCCALLAPAAPVAAQEANGPTDVPTVVTSPDGTPIVAVLHLPAGASAENPVPLILNGHGWGLSGDQTTSGSLYQGLLARGYAVMTWDARGFGESGGEAQVNALEFEGADTMALLDWAATQPQILLDGPGDPVVGMTGASYGGGIQLLMGAHDPRVDALAPEITWHSLPRALIPGGVLKITWLELLFGLGTATGTALGLSPDNPAGIQTGSVSQELFTAQVEGAAANTWGQDLLDFYTVRSLQSYGQANPVRPPTLLMQGSVDTLFTIDEARDTFAHLTANGTPAKLVIFCGSLAAQTPGNASTHGICPEFYTPANDRARMDDLIYRWFERHLRGDTSVDTGPAVEYRTNEGVWHRADDFPLPGAATLTAEVAGQLATVSAPASGAGIAAHATSADDPSAITVTIVEATDEPLEIIGTPHLSADITGTGTGAHLFIRLVDRESGDLGIGEGHVLNQQETPLIVGELSDDAQHVEQDLVSVAYTLPAGHTLEAQIGSSSSVFTNYRGAPAQVAVDGTIAVPIRRTMVDRVAGTNRIVTAAELSRDAVNFATTVVIARADAYADALAGAPLAAALGAPLLLTSRDGLSAAARREVQRLAATDAVLLGGTAALSPAVEADLTALGVQTVQRISGSDRFTTAAAVAQRLAEIAPPTTAYLVEGANPDPNRGWPDAVSASGIAAGQHAAILLTEQDRLPQATADALVGYTDVVVVGGTAAVSAAVSDAAGVAAEGATLERVAGADRYATSALVAQRALAATPVEGAAAVTPHTTVLATGRDWPDALVAGRVAAAANGILLLVDGRDLDGSPASRDLLGSLAADITRLVVAGGTAAISAATSDRAGAVISR